MLARSRTWRLANKRSPCLFSYTRGGQGPLKCPGSAIAMPNWKTTYELLRKLEQLAAAPDRAAVWQGVLELILPALEASGGRIERDYPRAVLASVGPED